MRKFLIVNPNPDEKEKCWGERTLDLGEGSEVVYIPRFLDPDQSWEWFRYLDKEIDPMDAAFNTRLRQVMPAVFVQPRDTCYVAGKGLQKLQYSGYQPHAYSWDDFPPLKDILKAVHDALPGSSFNSLLLNRYKNGSDYVSWHSDDEKLYGPTPEIASVSFGCDREFLLKKRPPRKTREGQASSTRISETCTAKHLKMSNTDQHSFTLKHGSLLVMRGNLQRDWLHSVPKCAKADGVRINLTFRHVMS